MAWGYWFSPELGGDQEPREKQLELMEWHQVAEHVTIRRLKEWNVAERR